MGSVLSLLVPFLLAVRDRETRTDPFHPPILPELGHGFTEYLPSYNTVHERPSIVKDHRGKEDGRAAGGAREGRQMGDAPIRDG